MERASTFFGVTLESLTFFGVTLEFFGVSEGLLGPFVLISFRSYGGILIENSRVILPLGFADSAKLCFPFTSTESLFLIESSNPLMHYNIDEVMYKESFIFRDQ